MRYFTHKIINPYIKENRYKKLCEIGASYGDNTDKLLELPSVTISIIDPCLDEDLPDKYKNNKRVKIFKGRSLDFLSKIEACFDSILIDGDHNWFTVLNELKTIEERNLLKKDGTIFLHDVYGPWGRRDTYYFPDSIPREYTHPYAPEVFTDDKSNPGTIKVLKNCAIYEGGPRNGVLTAVEDFLKEYGHKYIFSTIKEECGLSFLIKKI